MTGLADDLAGLVVATNRNDLPDVVVERVKAIMVDAVGCALVGRIAPETAQVTHAARGLGAGGSSIIGSAKTLSAGGAIFVNSYLLTAMTICDVYRPAVFHVSPQVVPPALVVGEQTHASGADALLAVAVGLETSVRLARVVDYPSFRGRGWHSPGVFGPYGAAAGTGRLLGLDKQAQRDAFGLAGSQSSSTFASWGTPAIKFHQARAALSGYLAATLAQTGFSGAPEILTSPEGGLYTTYAAGSDPARVTEGWGEEWELMEISLKRWPAVTALQTLLTSVFSLVEGRDTAPGHIKDIHVSLPSGIYRSYGQVDGDTPFLAKLSARYLTAVVALDRRCWLDQFTEERLTRQDVVEFARDSVVLEETPELDESEVCVVMRLADGSTVEDHRRVARGDPGDPLSLDDVTEKFREGVREILPTHRLEPLLEQLLNLEEVPDVAELMGSLKVDS